MIYSVSKLTQKEILTTKVKERFGIEVVEKDLHFITIDEDVAYKLEAKNYP